MVLLAAHPEWATVLMASMDFADEGVLLMVRYY
jgi:hypothetical protein